jgi:hypothetical protein
MKVRNLLRTGCAIALIAGFSSVAAANEQEPSQQTLEAMGLGGLSLMSDDEAMSVRGQGYSQARAYGASFARISTHGGSAGSVNGYSAKGKRYASGDNHSFAGAIIIKSKGKKGGHHGGNQNGPPMSRSGGGYGGKGGKGGHGGKPSVKFIKVFAGGSSSARAN